MAKKLQISSVRRFMMWAFGPPSNDPYISANFDFEFEEALKFLEEYNEKSSCKITIHHFLLKALADTLAKHPRLNVKIFGSELYQLPAVNIASPVNLLKQGSSATTSELGVAMVHDADRKSFEEIARIYSSHRENYRKHGSVYLMEEITKFIASAMPNFSLRLFLKGVGALGHNRYLYRLAHDLMGASTVFTNVGAVTSPRQGVHYKGIAVTIPDKMVYLGTVFGVGPMEKKVFVENDRPVVRRAIPMLVIFDHRIIDGFLMSQFIDDLGDHIIDPRKYYTVTSKPNIE